MQNRQIREKGKARSNTLKNNAVMENDSLRKDKRKHLVLSTQAGWRSLDKGVPCDDGGCKRTMRPSPQTGGYF